MSLHFHVSIVTYNRAKYLEVMLESLFVQSYRNFTITVYDNASSDQTFRLCSGYESRKLIEYVRHAENIGGLANINYALSLARSDIHLVVHDDDILQKDFLAQLASDFGRLGKSVVGISCNAKVIDKSGSLTGRLVLGKIHSRILAQGTLLNEYLWTSKNPIVFPTLAIWTETARTLRLDEAAGPGADVVLNSRLSSLGPLYISSSSFYLYRSHEVQDSALNAMALEYRLLNYLVSGKLANAAALHFFRFRLWIASLKRLVSNAVHRSS